MTHRCNSTLSTRLPPSQWEPGVERLLQVLNPWLQSKWQTEIVPSAEEPFYRPAGDSAEFHQIEFAHGYFNSALHELAHWCIAGEHRRTLPDYGYWYEPDGRSAEQQALFEQVEVKPQAIEYHFTLACQRAFRVSIDNLNGVETDPAPFRQAVTEQAQKFQRTGLPPRAEQACALMADAFKTDRRRFSF